MDPGAKIKLIMLDKKCVGGWITWLTCGTLYVLVELIIANILVIVILFHRGLKEGWQSVPLWECVRSCLRWTGIPFKVYSHYSVPREYLWSTTDLIRISGQWYCLGSWRVGRHPCWPEAADWIKLFASYLIYLRLKMQSKHWGWIIFCNQQNPWGVLVCLKKCANMFKVLGMTLLTAAQVTKNEGEVLMYRCIIVNIIWCTGYSFPMTLTDK